MSKTKNHMYINVKSEEPVDLASEFDAAIEQVFECPSFPPDTKAEVVTVFEQSGEGPSIAHRWTAQLFRVVKNSKAGQVRERVGMCFHISCWKAIEAGWRVADSTKAENEAFFRPMLDLAAAEKQIELGSDAARAESRKPRVQFVKVLPAEVQA
jgi:hypothetical protein